MNIVLSEDLFQVGICHRLHTEHLHDTYFPLDSITAPDAPEIVERVERRFGLGACSKRGHDRSWGLGPGFQTEDLGPGSGRVRCEDGDFQVHVGLGWDTRLEFGVDHFDI